MVNFGDMLSDIIFQAALYSTRRFPLDRVGLDIVWCTLTLRHEARCIVGTLARKDPASGPLFSQVEREALELASRNCRGDYGAEHVSVWKELKARGLVRNVREGGSAWYELTGKGRVALSRIRPIP
jgi:hypothetical protein